MKKYLLLLLILFSGLITSCSNSKKLANTSINSKRAFYDTIWELEYISGPRIAFDGLYPDKKPFIQFKEAKKHFGGDSSCNVYSGTYTKKENAIRFGDVIKTMAYCEGGGEETYLKMLGKVNKFAIDSDGKLVLLADDIPMMRFKKSIK